MLRRPTLLVALCAVVLGLGACGADGERTALAVQEVRWADASTLVVGTECADLDEVVFTPGRDGHPPVLTMWGSPNVGRCTTEVRVPVPPGTTVLLDETTSKIVELPPPPA